MDKTEEVAILFTQVTSVALPCISRAGGLQSSSPGHTNPARVEGHSILCSNCKPPQTCSDDAYKNLITLPTVHMCMIAESPFLTEGLLLKICTHTTNSSSASLHTELSTLKLI